MGIQRFDRLDIATTDLADASSVYERNFGLTVRRSPGSQEAVIAIGGAEIRLRTGSGDTAHIAGGGEGLAAIWLETDDVDAVAAALSGAGLSFSPVRVEAGRRILAVDPKSANMVPLFILDRRV